MHRAPALFRSAAHVIKGIPAGSTVNRKKQPKMKCRAGDAVAGRADGDGVDAGFLCLMSRK
jgi:hypothetical protein